MFVSNLPLRLFLCRTQFLPLESDGDPMRDMTSWGSAESKRAKTFIVQVCRRGERERDRRRGLKILSFLGFFFKK